MVSLIAVINVLIIGLHSLIQPVNFKQMFVRTYFTRTNVCGLNDDYPKTLPKNGNVLLYKRKEDLILKRKCLLEDERSKENQAGKMITKYFDFLTSLGESGIFPLVSSEVSKID